MSAPALPPRGRERLLGVALELFARHGFDRTSTRDIGRAAGLTSPALYRHYPSKDALGLDLYRRCYARVLAAVHAATAHEPEPLARLCAYVGAVTTLAEREPATLLYVDEHQVRFWPLLRHEFAPGTLSGLVLEWVDAGRAAGTIDRHGPAAAQAALVLGLPSQWAAMRAAGLVPTPDAGGLAGLVRRALAAGDRS